MTTPTNPPLRSGQPERGLTQVVNGALQHQISSASPWQRAVRLNTIRTQLIQNSATQGPYTHGRGSGKEADNVTACLLKDKAFGGARIERPPILFQLDPTPDQYKSEPQGVMMYQGQIVLDPYDHPVRDFPNELPPTLSTEMNGWEIEYYLRQNRAIKSYDLMARCREDYLDSRNKFHAGPPRIASLVERATKFREKACCLSWNPKEGSQEIKNYILGKLPAGATTTNPITADLTLSQLKDLKAGNKGRYPNRRSKAKRAEEVQGQLQQLQAQLQQHVQQQRLHEAYLMQEQNRLWGIEGGDSPSDPQNEQEEEDHLQQEQNRLWGIEAAGHSSHNWDQQQGVGAFGNDAHEQGYGVAQEEDAEIFDTPTLGRGKGKGRRGSSGWVISYSNPIQPHFDNETSNGNLSSGSLNAYSPTVQTQNRKRGIEEVSREAYYDDSPGPSNKRPRANNDRSETSVAPRGGSRKTREPRVSSKRDTEQLLRQRDIIKPKPSLSTRDANGSLFSTQADGIQGRKRKADSPTEPVITKKVRPSPESTNNQSRDMAPPVLSSGYSVTSFPSPNQDASQGYGDVYFANPHHDLPGPDFSTPAREAGLYHPTISANNVTSHRAPQPDDFTPAALPSHQFNNTFDSQGVTMDGYPTLSHPLCKFNDPLGYHQAIINVLNGVVPADEIPASNPNYPPTVLAAYKDYGTAQEEPYISNPPSAMSTTIQDFDPGNDFLWNEIAVDPQETTIFQPSPNDARPVGSAPSNDLGNGTIHDQE